MALRVLVADDHRLTATALADSLTLRGLSVTGVAHSVSEAYERVVESSPDVVVTDLDLGIGPTGIDLAIKVREQFPSTAVVILTAYEDPKLLSPDMPVPPPEVVYLVKQRVAQVDDLLAAVHLAVQYVTQPDTIPRRGNKFPLSRPQATVLRLVAQGLSNQSIADQLHLTPDAVAKAINRLAKRFGLSQNTETNVRVLLTQRYFDLVGYLSEG